MRTIHRTLERFLISIVIHEYHTSWILLTSLKGCYLNQQIEIQSWYDLQNIYYY